MANTDLLKLVEDIEAAENEWISAREKSDLLSEDQRSFLDSLKNDLDNGTLSDAKLTRLAQGSKDYRDYVVGMVLAKSATLRKKARQNKLEREFEARRSIGAYERARLEKGLSGYGK
jgi:hypothetical protein